MKLAFRIYQKDWETDEAFAKLEKVVLQYRSCMDELALFVDFSHHGYYPLSYYRTLLPVLTARIGRLRADGVPSVGINVLDSIGHMDEAWDWLEQAPFRTCVGHDGASSYSCSCVRDPEYLDYIAAKYGILAQAGPAFIWVDDDVRMQHHHVEFPCFCKQCVARFNALAGTRFRRETLVKALDAPGSAVLRSKFLQFNRDALNTLLQTIGDAIRAVSPEIGVGLMTTDVSWSSYALSDQEGMLRALGADRLRPGGGFYDDEWPLLLYTKAVNVTLQNAHAGGIADRQYELEDFPDSCRKSLHMHRIEIITALMSGCSGIAVNSMLPGMTPDLIEGLAADKPFWSALEKHLAGTALRGFCPVYVCGCDAAESIRHSIFTNQAQRSFFSESELTKLGLSWTCEPQDAAVTAISGDMLCAMSEAELEAAFRRGVILDMEALEALQARGHADWAGCRPGKAYHSGLLEKYLPHPINGEAAGEKRDVYMTFWDPDGITVRALELDDGAEPLSELVSITGVPCGIGASVYRNALGGRVSVQSYFPWRFLEMPGKRSTAAALMDWLADGAYPILTYGGKRILPMLRTGADSFTAWLLNASFDPAQDVTVRICTTCGNVRAVDHLGRALTLPENAVEQKDGFLWVRLPQIPPWAGVLLTEDA